jgi:hypothetical protein
VSTEVPARVWFDPNTGRLQVTIDAGPGGKRTDVKHVTVRFEYPGGSYDESQIGVPRPASQPRRKGGHIAADVPVSAMGPLPAALTKPAPSEPAEPGEQFEPGKTYRCLTAHSIFHCDHLTGPPPVVAIGLGTPRTRGRGIYRVFHPVRDPGEWVEAPEIPHLALTDWDGE